MRSLKPLSRPTAKGLWPQVEDQGAAYQTEAEARRSGAQVIVILQVTLTDRSDGKVLFSRPNLEVRERYEISVDAKTYFEESDVAMDRLSRDVARSVVSAVLENF